jgi:hypothetical protein
MLKKLAAPFLAIAALLAFAVPAHSGTTYVNGGENRADMPRQNVSPLRLIPVAGASSFTTNDKVDLKHFDGSFAAGLLADLGDSYLNFETGIQTLSTRGHAENGNAAFSVNTWGIPLLAKFNFSGNPHQTVFAKAGAMPFTSSGDGRSGFNVLGVAGIGGNIGLGQNSSLVLDATYNRLFTKNGDLTSYQGIALMAGLSFNL